MSTIVQHKMSALSAAPVVGLSVTAGRSAGRTLPTIAHGSGLTAAGIAAIVVVVAAAVAVAVIGWRLDQRSLLKRQRVEQDGARAASPVAKAASGAPSITASSAAKKAGSAPSFARSAGGDGGEPAGARARRMPPREGEERR